MVAKVEVTFRAGQAPVGSLEGPSAAIASDKTEFGSSRIRRWFGHVGSSPERGDNWPELGLPGPRNGTHSEWMSSIGRHQLYNKVSPPNVVTTSRGVTVLPPETIQWLRYLRKSLHSNEIDDERLRD